MKKQRSVNINRLPNITEASKKKMAYLTELGDKYKVKIEWNYNKDVWQDRVVRITIQNNGKNQILYFNTDEMMAYLRLV